MNDLVKDTPDSSVGRLEARHLQKYYGKRQVVKDVSLAVRTGEVVGLLGPNGAGKTTSFYMIVGLLRASAGVSAKDCREAGCEDPLPGWTAPEGSTLAIWTCEGNVFREVVYERINGTWRVKSVREELVVSCQVSKEPGEDKEPRDGKE